MVVSNSAISKVFRQIAYLIEFEAKGNEDIDNEYKGETDKKYNDSNKINAVFKAKHTDEQLMSLRIYLQIWKTYTIKRS